MWGGWTWASLHAELRIFCVNFFFHGEPCSKIFCVFSFFEEQSKHLVDFVLFILGMSGPVEALQDVGTLPVPATDDLLQIIKNIYIKSVQKEMGTSELRSLKEFSWLHLTKSELPCVRLGGISVQSSRGDICHLGRQGWELAVPMSHQCVSNGSASRSARCLSHSQSHH